MVSDSLVERARRLMDGRRRILGITGAPASGKSTLAEELVAALGPRAVAVSMDGFHLAQAELERLGRAERKGAPDTFDPAGYVSLLRRLRNESGTVYAPLFRREIEEPIAGAVPVAPEIALVVTEGNYLLLDGPWQPVRGLLDEVWYVDPPEDVRIDRLVRRHVRFGRDESVARARANGTDQRNAELIIACRERADLVVTG